MACMLGSGGALMSMIQGRMGWNAGLPIRRPARWFSCSRYSKLLTCQHVHMFLSGQANQCHTGCHLVMCKALQQVTVSRRS